MDDIEKITDWLKEEKGITKITLEELINLIPEYKGNEN